MSFRETALVRRTLVVLVVASVLAVGLAALRPARATAGRFQRFNDNTANAYVLDSATGLKWEVHSPSSTRGHCDKWTADGGGWRSPTIKELATIYDDNGRFDATVFGQHQYGGTNHYSATYFTTRSGGLDRFFIYGDGKIRGGVYQAASRCVK